jgi:predicted nucleic acid-binding protein
LTSAYVDSSFLLAIAFGEPSATRLTERLDRFDNVYASDLVEAEVLSALAREAVALPGADAFGSLNWTFPDRRLTQEFTRILATGYLKGADLWHVACALYLSPSPQDLSFLTLDARQKRVAAKLGFHV